MRYSIFIVILLTVLIACNNKKEATNNKLRAYVASKDDYYKNQVDTAFLKGGGYLYYMIDDSSKYLYLYNGSNKYLLNQHKLDEGSFYYLGILQSDYDNYFLLGHDNGNGVPYSGELIDKKSGKNLWHQKVTLLEHDGDSNYVFFLPESNTITDKFTLCYIPTLKQQQFPLPEKVQQDTHNNPLSMFVHRSTKTHQLRVSFEFVNAPSLYKTYVIDSSLFIVQ